MTPEMVDAKTGKRIDPNGVWYGLDIPAGKTGLRLYANPSDVAEQALAGLDGDKHHDASWCFTADALSHDQANAYGGILQRLTRPIRGTSPRGYQSRSSGLIRIDGTHNPPLAEVTRFQSSRWRPTE